MKKKKSLLIIGGICLCMTIGSTMVSNNTCNYLSSIILANADALASSGEGSTGDTGPGEIVDCGGIGTGSKKECLCTNSNPCTPTQCK